MEASPTYEPLAQHPVATRLLTSQPDSVLCRLAARGNVGAYDALYQRYRQPVFAFVFHLLGRADGNEDAEDIAQDTFTRAFAGIREKRVDGSFRGWLFTIARNRTYDMIRARKQNVVSLDAEAAEAPPAPQADQPAERAEQRAELAWLMTAVAALPERQREALLLREMGGFSHERIAEQLGTSVSATKKLISRGRDGIGEAAGSGGYGRVSRRKLGHDLALAAPMVPLSITLASVGVTAGAGGVAGGMAAGSAVAGGSAVIGGKAAATALTVVAIGGGAVAVRHDVAPARQAPAAVRQAAPARPRANALAATPGARNESVSGRPDGAGPGGGRRPAPSDVASGSGNDDGGGPGGSQLRPRGGRGSSGLGPGDDRVSRGDVEGSNDSPAPGQAPRMGRGGQGSGSGAIAGEDEAPPPPGGTRGDGGTSNSGGGSSSGNSGSGSDDGASGDGE